MFLSLFHRIGTLMRKLQRDRWTCGFFPTSFTVSGTWIQQEEIDLRENRFFCAENLNAGPFPPGQERPWNSQNRESVLNTKENSSFPLVLSGSLMPPGISKERNMLKEEAAISGTQISDCSHVVKYCYFVCVELGGTW